MKLKRFRSNHDEIGPTDRPENPFSSHKGPEIRTVEFDLEVEPGEPADPDLYFQAVKRGARFFPWFGEFRFASAAGIGYELRMRSVSGIRRVLISFLAGRPMTAVAARIPTSRRNAYMHIERAIYVGDIHGWTELGLIRAWDIPALEADTNVLLSDGWLDEDHTPVICLLCRRLIGHIKLWERRHDSSLLESADIQYEYGSRAEEEIRGHLIAHFFLGGRPKPNESFKTVFGLIGYNPGKWVAVRWLDQVDSVAITTAFDHQRLIHPVVDGKSPTDDEVREYYRGLL